MFAAEQQLEAAQGVQDTPFVTMKLTINEQHEIIVEAFQVLRVLCFVPPFTSGNPFCMSRGLLQTNRLRMCGDCTKSLHVLLCVMYYCLSTCAALYLLSRSHPVTLITNTPAWPHPFDESGDRGSYHSAPYLYLLVVDLPPL
jgi:hypothetical protein